MIGLRNRFVLVVFIPSILLLQYFLKMSDDSDEIPEASFMLRIVAPTAIGIAGAAVLGISIRMGYRMQLNRAVKQIVEESNLTDAAEKAKLAQAKLQAATQASRIALKAVTYGTGIAVGTFVGGAALTAWYLQVRSIDEFMGRMNEVVPRFRKTLETGLDVPLGALRSSSVAAIRYLSLTQTADANKPNDEDTAAEQWIAAQIDMIDKDVKGEAAPKPRDLAQWLQQAAAEDEAISQNTQQQQRGKEEMK